MAEFDPRRLPLDIVGGVDLSGRPLPCGQEQCTPLERDCLEHGTDKEQAMLACARLMGNVVLHERLDATKERLTAATETVTAHEQLIKRLSVDKNTGILTLNAHQALYEQLLSTGMLERMKDEGYVQETTMGDADKLKIHNTLGDHNGGNVVLREIARQMKELYRRDYDIVGILEYLDEAKMALAENGQLDMLARFETGDEVIVISFIPPYLSNDPNRGLPRHQIDAQVARVSEAFADVWVEYPLKRGLNYSQLQQPLHEIGFNFTVQDGIVRAPVTLTFATILSNVATSIAEFEALKTAADASMMATKSMRKTIVTRGSGTNLLQAA